MAGGAFHNKGEIMTEVIEINPWKNHPECLRPYMGTSLEAKALEMYEQAKAQVVKEIVEEATNEGVQSVRERIIGLAKVQFGEAEAKRFAAIIESGMSESQYRNIRPQLVESACESQELKALRVVRSDLDQALNNSDDGEDFMTMVEKTMARDGVTKTEALARVSAQRPELHKRYLESHNPVREV